MNGFESVNLDSTVLEERPKRLRTVLESASTTSDEEDLDPHDFITSESHVIPTDHISSPIRPDRQQLQSEEEDEDEDNDNEEAHLADQSHESSESNQFSDESNHFIESFSHSTVPNTIQTTSPYDLSPSLTPIVLDSYVLNSPMLESSFVGLTSDLKGSMLQFPKPPNIDHTGDNMVEFMLKKCQKLQEELAYNANAQNVYINEGSDKLDKTRVRILKNLAKLSESYYALHELYQREKEYVSATYNSFNLWDKKRSKLLDKISSVKSTQNKYGKKLAGLLDDSHAVDNEISELENRLRSLRNKKLVLNAEINTTASVLESKTSKHVAMFRNLDDMGYEALTVFLNELGIPEDQIDNVIDFSPVDVTFMNKYRATSKIALASVHSNDTITKESAATPMGIQPYSAPEEETQIDLTSLSPFAKGFAKGSKSSKKLRDQIFAIIQNYLSSEKRSHEQQQSPSIPKTNEIQVDDDQNTISTKLNLEPILRLLSHKKRALDDLDLDASKKAANFHQCDNAWSDLQQVLAQQERKLLSYLEASTNMQSEGVKNTTVSIIEASINQIQSNLERNNFKAFDPTLKLAIVHEIRALIAAIKLVANADLTGSLASLARLGITEDLLFSSDKGLEYQEQYSKSLAVRDSTTISNDLGYFGIPLESLMGIKQSSPQILELNTVTGPSKQIKKE